MESDPKRVTRVTVILERADGTKHTCSVAEIDPTRPVLDEFAWNREPVELPWSATGVSYRVFKPGPVLDLTVRASGAPDEEPAA